MAKKVEIKEYVDRGVKDFDPKKKNCIVTDLDGTLALINGRGYFESWRFDTDILNESVAAIIDDLLYLNDNTNTERKRYELIVITGRSEAGAGRQKTEKWLNENSVIYDKLFMRKAGDFRKDYITKSEIIQELQKEYNIICAFDDRDSSAKAFRDNGVLCLQVWEDDTEKKPCHACKEIENKEELPASTQLALFMINYCPQCGRKLK